jgi:putative acetyltransferase
VDCQPGVAIGSIGFEPDPKRPEIKARKLGYSLAEEYWGMGLMTEAGRAVIDYGFRVMELDVISIETAPDNTRSQRVIEKLGFKYEGTLRDSYLTIDDEVRDTCVYSILRSEWNG